MKYTTKLIKHEEVAGGTMAFYFEKPDGFTFIAGQFIELTLINPSETDEEGNTRAFSIIASPDEDYLAVTTRMRDTSFKRQLKSLNSGDEIQLEGPFGNFILHEKTTRPAIFLVGGIGITPFMSIIKDSLTRNTGHQMYLFYSNRQPEDAAFLTELQSLDQSHDNFTLIATMTDMENSHQEWTGETGYINKDMIDHHVPETQQAIYYTAGPAIMVAAMRKLLNENGVSNDDIKTEEFSGY